MSEQEVPRLWCQKCQAWGQHDTGQHEVIVSEDWGAKAHAVAMDHLQACMDAMDDEDGEIEDPSSAPFDGCLDCLVRETLFAASPIFETAMVGCPHASWYVP